MILHFTKEKLVIFFKMRTLSEVTWTILLVAHGTIQSLDELPAFVSTIRHGRPAPPELLQELRARYERIGQSPLLKQTEHLAQLVEARLQTPTRVAMRLWKPRVEEVLADLPAASLICCVPLAPWSVEVYERAALHSLTQLPQKLSLHTVEPWGTHPSWIQTWVERISTHLSQNETHLRAPYRVLLTAHSLPQRVIDQGDLYAKRFEQCAQAIAQQLGGDCRIAYQSQGAQDGQWLGPSLEDALHEAARDSIGTVVVAPVGFLCEHVETLYDLDIEARAWAEELGLEFSRVSTPHDDPLLVETIAALVQSAQERAAAPPAIDS